VRLVIVVRHLHGLRRPWWIADKFHLIAFQRYRDVYSCTLLLCVIGAASFSAIKGPSSEVYQVPQFSVHFSFLLLMLMLNTKTLVHFLLLYVLFRLLKTLLRTFFSSSKFRGIPGPLPESWFKGALFTSDQVARLVIHRYICF